MSYSDTFTGADGASWNAAWSTSFNYFNGSNGVCDIQSNAGRMQMDSDGTGFDGVNAELASTTVTDFDMSVDFQFNTSTEKYLAIPFRYDSLWGFKGGYPNNGYYVQTRPDGFLWLRRIDGTFSQNDLSFVNLGFTFTTSTWYTMRIFATGSTLDVSVWLTSGSPPGTPQASGTDATYASGNFALGFTAGTETGGKLLFDNFSLSTGGGGSGSEVPRRRRNLGLAIRGRR